MGVVSHFFSKELNLLIIDVGTVRKSKRKDPRTNDLTEFLKIAKPSDFKGYLEWRKDSSGITRQQSMYTRWCYLSMVYQHTAKRYMPEEVLSDIRNVGCSLGSISGHADFCCSGYPNWSSTIRTGRRKRSLSKICASSNTASGTR